MHISELLDMEDLLKAMEGKLINVRQSPTGESIYNYSNAAMFTPGAWDSHAVRQCRGLIVSLEGKVLARPWAKFYNHGQAEAGTLRMDAPVEVTDKMDGSLGVLYYNGMGDPMVASRGSFQSEQAHHATKILWTKYASLSWDGELITPLVEIIYPENRIVCDYGDMDDLVLLGGVIVETGKYVGPNETASIIGWSGPVTETFEYKTLREALMAPPSEGKEGMCVRYLDEPHIVKIKQADYVALHKIVFGLSEKSIWQHCMDGGTLESLLDPLPDELHAWATGTYHTLIDKQNHLFLKSFDEYEAIIEKAGAEGLTRAEFAQQAKACTFPALQFMLFDGRDINKAVLKMLKPKGNALAKEQSEDVA